MVEFISEELGPEFNVNWLDGGFDDDATGGDCSLDSCMSGGCVVDG